MKQELTSAQAAEAERLKAEGKTVVVIYELKPYQQPEFSHLAAFDTPEQAEHRVFHLNTQPGTMAHTYED